MDYINKVEERAYDIGKIVEKIADWGFHTDYAIEIVKLAVLSIQNKGDDHEDNH